MAAITWTDVTTLAASLTAVPSGAQTAILAYVNSNVNAAKLGGESTQKTKLARIYLAAHMGELERRAAADATGAYTTLRGKKLSRDGFELDFGVLDAAAASLDETVHGRAYHQLIRTSACRVGFVVK